MNWSLQVTLHAYEVEDLYEALVFVGWGQEAPEHLDGGLSNLNGAEASNPKPQFAATITTDAATGIFFVYNFAKENANLVAIEIFRPDNAANGINLTGNRHLLPVVFPREASVIDADNLVSDFPI